MAANQGSLINYTNKDFASLREAMLEVAREKLPVWTDHSDNDLGVLLVELFAGMGDLLLYYQDRIASESYLATAAEPRSVVNLLRLIGYELEPSKPASADVTLLFDPAKLTDPNETLIIPPGLEVTTTVETAGAVIPFRYTGTEPIDIRVSELGAPTPIQIGNTVKNYLRFDTLPVRQVDRVISGETVGSSDGSSGQRFALALAPLIEGTLQLTVSEEGIPRLWEQRETLLESRSSDTHYMVQRDEREVAWVEFGDGRFGRVPPKGSDNIVASYMVGGGTRGNVAPNTIVKLGEHTSEVKGLVAVLQPNRASGGTDRETLDVAALRAPRQFRTRGRAVTEQDYESHALKLGVGKARARATGWSRVQLYVAPAGGGYPSDSLKEDIRRYLEDKRIMTTFVDVMDPKYVKVVIAGELEIEPYYLTRQVRQVADAAVAALLAFDNVTFQQTLYLSKVYEALEAVEGVRAANITLFARRDHPLLSSEPADLPLSALSRLILPEHGKLEFAWEELPTTDGVVWLNVTGGRRAG